MQRDRSPKPAAGRHPRKRQRRSEGGRQTITEHMSRSDLFSRKGVVGAQHIDERTSQRSTYHTDLTRIRLIRSRGSNTRVRSAKVTDRSPGDRGHGPGGVHAKEFRRRSRVAEPRAVHRAGLPPHVLPNRSAREEMHALGHSESWVPTGDHHDELTVTYSRPTGVRFCSTVRHREHQVTPTALESERWGRPAGSPDWVMSRSAGRAASTSAQRLAPRRRRR